MSYPGYPVELDSIEFGVPFEMLNYDGMYIRVYSPSDFQTISKYRHANPLSFNDDGYHVPVVEMATGILFGMAKVKPCRLAD